MHNRRVLRNFVRRAWRPSRVHDHITRTVVDGPVRAREADINLRWFRAQPPTTERVIGDRSVVQMKRDINLAKSNRAKTPCESAKLWAGVFRDPRSREVVGRRNFHDESAIGDEAFEGSFDIEDGCFIEGRKRRHAAFKRRVGLHIIRARLHALGDEPRRDRHDRRDEQESAAKQQLRDERGESHVAGA